MIGRGWARLSAVPFAVLIALIAIDSTIVFLLYPHASAISSLPTALEYVWVVQYGLGGALLLTGIATGRGNVEAAGCCGFMGGALVNSATRIFAGGPLAWNAVLVLCLFSGATFVRFVHLLQRRTLVLLPPPGRPPR